MKTIVTLVHFLPVLGSAVVVLKGMTPQNKVNMVSPEDTIVMGTLPSIGNLKELSSTASTIGPSLCGNTTNLVLTAAQLKTLGENCKELTGSLQIDAGYIEEEVDLGGIEKVGGSFSVNNSKTVKKIVGANLKGIGGKFELTNLTTLTNVDLGKLEDTKEILWEILPSFNSVNLNGAFKGLNSVKISDTALTNINWLNNKVVGSTGNLSTTNSGGSLRQLEVLDINNNRYLSTIDSNVYKINGIFNVHANSGDLSLKLNELQTVGDISIRDTRNIELKNLEAVTKSFGLIENAGLQSLSAPKLKTIEGTFGIIDNPQLSEIYLTKLLSINGGLLIVNNTRLTKINFFPSLESIGGGIHFEGPFTETKFDSLKIIRGSANIRSSSETFDCSMWTKPAGERSVIRGREITCVTGKKENVVKLNDDGKIVDKIEHDIQNNKTGSIGLPSGITWKKDGTSSASDSTSNSRYILPTGNITGNVTTTTDGARVAGDKSKNGSGQLQIGYTVAIVAALLASIIVIR